MAQIKVLPPLSLPSYTPLGGLVVQAFLAEMQAYLDMLKDEQARLARLKEALSSRSGAFVEIALTDVNQWEIVLKRIEATLLQILKYLEEGRMINASTTACTAQSYIHSIIIKSSQLTGLAGHIYANLQPLIARINDSLSRMCRSEGS